MPQHGCCVCVCVCVGGFPKTLEELNNPSTSQGREQARLQLPHQQLEVQVQVPAGPRLDWLNP
jgi:hypothetical protein